PTGGVISFTFEPRGSENYWMMMGIRIREYGIPEPPPPSEPTFRAVYKSESGQPFSYYEDLPENYEARAANDEKIHIILFYHGRGERGDGSVGDLPKVLTWGLPKMCSEGNFTEDFIVISPQWLGYSDDAYYDPVTFKSFIDHILSEYSVDLDRVYVTG